MKFFHESVCCPECKALRINTSSDFSVCPNGHGKLLPHLLDSDIERAFCASLPAAKRVSQRRRFEIPGQQGQWRPTDRVRYFQEVGTTAVVAAWVRSKRTRAFKFELIPPKEKKPRKKKEKAAQ